MTRASQSAANKVTCVVAFGGNVNEVQGGSDYKRKHEQLLAAGETDLAELYGIFTNHEAIHQATYAKIFKRYYERLSGRGKAHVRWLGPNHFDIVGEKELGASRLGEIIVECGYDEQELADLLDSFGSRLIGEPLSFAHRALFVCAEAWREDKKKGLLAEQQN